jgi:hypothetical protein
VPTTTTRTIMFIDGIEFDEYKIKSVKLDLETCLITFEVIWSKDKNRVVRIKEYTFDTDCNVDVNEYIKKLENNLNE